MKRPQAGQFGQASHRDGTGRVGLSSPEVTDRSQPQTPPHRLGPEAVKLDDLNKAAAELDPCRPEGLKRCPPLVAVFGQEVGLALGEGRASWLVRPVARQLDLRADELGSIRLAVIVEPVGEDQPRRVVVGMLKDVLVEGYFKRYEKRRNGLSVGDAVGVQKMDVGEFYLAPASPSIPTKIRRGLVRCIAGSNNSPAGRLAPFAAGPFPYPLWRSIMVRMLFGMIALVAGALLLTGEVRAESKKLDVKILYQGSLDDRTLEKKKPANGVIATQKAFDELFTAWKLGEQKPRINFAKDLVLVTTTVGSRLSLAATVDSDKGDLQVGGVSTRDLRPGFRYVVGVVSREGIKTVGGKELPKD